MISNSMSKQRIVFVSCCYNEAENLVALYDSIESTMAQVKDVKWHLLLVDDASSDSTPSLVETMISQSKKIEYIQFSRNFGKEAALTAGLDLVHDADASILLDADLQHPIKYVPEMIELWRQGASMVIAVPTIRNRDLIGKLSSFLYHKLISWASKSPVTFAGGDFRLLDRASVLELSLMRERSRYMKGLYGYIGGNIQIIDYDEQARVHGDTKFSYTKRLSLALNGLISLTTLPLRLFSLLGIVAIAGGTAYMIFILIELMIHGKSVPGFASVLFSIIIFNGFIMLQIGVQGEYIAKILEEVKHRPLYIIKQHRRVDHSISDGDD